MRLELTVIGGGIIGLATAYRYLEGRPGAGVAVVEKEPAVGMHQSGHNSGVLHAGLYYRPGSAKARLARAGLRAMKEFCASTGVAYEVCGKLVVAADETELPRLRTLLDRGRANGLEGLRWLGPEEMREIEPHVGGVAAVHVPEEGIADFPGVCRALADGIRERGGTVLLNQRVTGVRREGAGWRLETEAGDLSTSTFVNCGGLHSDRIARLAGEEPGSTIVPFRGEYYLLKEDRRHLVRNLIYPVPDPTFPFLGVHLTRRWSGGIEAGPNAVLAFAREGYQRTRVDPADLLEMARFGGLWRFVGRHPGASWREIRRSFSKDLFAASLRRLVPEVTVDDLVRPEGEGAGVRAQALRRNGDLVDDFLFVTKPGAVHVLNAPSPGATAALAIAGEILGELAATQAASS